ncbi:putative transmembrane protein [Clavispora lusitaniae]|uniref:Transmembrane protein n=2 Tax=Clavispora lusitaniae TaxID=36911 RepID=C4Y478_CLAL4|nr:uncharacterized protein CLUG_02450 [Clavispora lusitaniae ATCC 42720]KAF5211428.1 hypothetical protein E0198_002737 [Clavispora lusitaniae]EEQ38324.1 hypothetical protein CLUG_02450 [Clavispora lusitaniae ATCC 42720]KAF7580276.1 hypothetical protein FOB63_005346 [Clavispora lusitaniae]QFZ27841.1 putative transmembrane protein [Clavispora lusitaniae]QFZ32852.1 putative transmembrane protein [Clavispora lusitaniae]
MKIQLTVRFTDSGAGSEPYHDLSVPVLVNPKRDDINKLVNTSWLKMVIRTQVAGTERRRLRLIYNGRVLNDTTNFKNDILEPKLRQLRESGESTDIVQFYVHCLVGDEFTNAQLAKEKELDSKSQEVSTAPPVVGFDRLLSQGVSPQDVNDMRRQFHQIYSPDLLQNTSVSGVNDLEEDENRQEAIRQLEERWLEGTFNDAHPQAGGETGVALPPNAALRAAVESEGAHHTEDLLIGLLIGAFLGIVAGVFLLMDDTMFNKTQRSAIVAGIAGNIICIFTRATSV